MLVVIDQNPRMRDELARLAACSFRVTDFPDVDAAVARVTKEPAAILIGAGVPASGRTPPIERLRKHPTFGRTPVIRVGHARPATGGAAAADRVPDAELALPVTSHDLIRRICDLANKAVEGEWDKLPKGPRAALSQTLAVFSGIRDLVGKGKPIQFKTVSDACAPVLDSVRQSGHGYIFEGLRSHNDIWYVHSLRVATLLALFGHRIGLDDESLMTLASAGFVHDFGKTNYPEGLSSKMDALTPEEKAVAHNGHVLGTADYLRQHSDAPRAVVMVAEQHHERLDGSGYPKGLKNGDINDLARMAAIVDVFAALTERRSYRAAMTPMQALEVMEELLRDKLDMRLVRLFREMLLQAV
ncbi:Two-component response regulator [Paramagnetospirillum magnetotacticum MS-1]|uniref:Two-component response regulator n=2 Tax=Paramagnetospirillum magnetotacticum TaxID=188 RepID=A0A0C2YLR5_PARME|nr:Two-component response regulator [Paramagnetospirillum magnetotacticum MS-1]